MIRWFAVVLLAVVLMGFIPINRSSPQAISLVGQWSFDERGGRIAIDNVLKNNGSLGGSTLIFKDNYANFPGTSSNYINCPNFKWNAGSQITIMFWNKTAGGTTGSAINIGNQSSVSTNIVNCHAPYSDNNLYWDYGTNVAGRISTSYSAYLNKWTHIALVNNGVNWKAIYFNANIATSGTTVASPPVAMTGLTIGGWVISNNYHYGKMMDFRIYNRALSSNEIKEVYLNSKNLFINNR
jgi:hypothetical protein